MQLSLNVTDLVNSVGTLLGGSVMGLVNSVISEVNTVLSVVVSLLGGII